MRYPKYLEKKGTIGFIAPSFGCVIEPYKSRFENAIKIFEGLGYKINLGPNCYEGSGVGISNTPMACGDELNAAMTDSISDVIITCGGGELMCEVVPYIDFEDIKNSEPKWYMGYSDNTNYTFLSTTIADTAAIYGPCAPAFGREPWHKSIEDALKLLKGETDTVNSYDMWEKYEESDQETKEETEEEIRRKAILPYNVNEKTKFRYHTPDGKSEAQITGRLIGGCVDILNLLVGTKYDKVAEFQEKYREDGFIWFLECCDLNPLDMRRAFWHLREAGWFKYVKGFLIGRPLHFGEEALGVDQYNAVTDILGEFDVPILMDLDIGHLPPMLPIISGSMADIFAKDNELSINYRFE